MRLITKTNGFMADKEKRIYY